MFRLNRTATADWQENHDQPLRDIRRTHGRAIGMDRCGLDRRNRAGRGLDLGEIVSDIRLSELIAETGPWIGR